MVVYHLKEIFFFGQSPSRQQLYHSLAQHTVLCLRRLVGKTHLISDSGRGFKLETSGDILLWWENRKNPRELESEHFGRAEEDEKNGNEEGKQFGGKKGGSVKQWNPPDLNSEEPTTLPFYPCSSPTS
ncbi:hypothetical protein L3X38_013880 [Prunus dulcis]|uniref:Uncharacterized protein n=1 Tax=Prunus dulcis TaxID=3755 RepID=A0AAD4WMR5_PRUDU|nr:hypothetical protein L3X38_013880 [Prunus dulcis]